MATMWPRTIPAEIRNHPFRESECAVYDKLAAELDDGYVVFYSRPWLGQTASGAEIDGECDFVVAHPDKGILALEVKGGGVSYDPATEAWSTTNRYGIEEAIKNPVAQARTSKYQLLRKVRDNSQRRIRWIPAGHGVIFPDARAPDEDLGADMPLEIFCFLEEFEHDLRGWIDDRFEAIADTDHGDGSLGQDGIVALEAILARPFTLRVPLGRTLAGDERAISVLTQDQFHIMELIGSVRFAAITGGAGTGKTILAMEEALRRAEAGSTVLLTCFNRALALQMSEKLGAMPGLTVGTFHEICTRFARKAGVRLPNDENPPQSFYDEDLPEALAKALSLLPDQRFDAIIVDEGQDFLAPWLETLFLGLGDPDGTSVYRVFYDNNQRVYGTLATIPSIFKLTPIPLRYNLRNTRRIHREVARHYDGAPIQAKGPEGVDVEWISTEDFASTRRRINEKVASLVGQENVKPGEIVVLTESDGINVAIAPTWKVGGEKVFRCDQPGVDGVVVDTIRRFKGLESPVVILALTKGIVANDELVYVALSRARSYLCVIGEERFMDAIRGGEAKVAVDDQMKNGQ